MPRRPTEAGPAQSIGITTDEQIFVERGEIASHETHPPIETNVFRGRLFWLGRKPLTRGDALSAADADARRAGDRRGDRGDLRSRRAGPARRPTRSSATRSPTWSCAPTPCWRSTKRTRIRAPAASCWATAPTSSPAAPSACAAMPTSGSRSRRSRPTSPRSRTASPIRSESRATATTAACCGLPACPAAGKSTIAMAVEQELFRRGYQTYVLDGDNVRRGLNSNLDFSPEDRAENIRRVGEVAALFADSGLIVVTAFISPYRADRHRARAAAGDGFHEIYIKAEPRDLREARSQGPLPEGAQRRDRGVHRRHRTLRDAGIARAHHRHRPSLHRGKCGRGARVRGSKLPKNRVNRANLALCPISELKML